MKNIHSDFQEPQHNTKGKYKENHIYLKENHVQSHQIAINQNKGENSFKQPLRGKDLNIYW